MDILIKTFSLKNRTVVRFWSYIMLVKTNYNMALLWGGEGTTSSTKNDIVSECSHL